MGTEQEVLQPADLPVITTLRGSVDALLELKYLPLNLRPADGIPLIHRSQCRAHHFCTPTRPSTFHTSVLTSAYPLAFLVPRQSSLDKFSAIGCPYGKAPIEENEDGQIHC
jgi:hypothetical protein